MTTTMEEPSMATKKKAEPDGGRVRFTVYLPPETRDALIRNAFEESAAAGERVSATQIVERLIDHYLHRKGAQHGR